MAMRSAIVGCGGIAQVHGNVLHEMTNVHLVAAADCIFEKAETFCKQFGGRPYPNLFQMLESEKIDILHICTPHYLHAPMATEALKRDMHVLLEKPCATNYEEFKQLQDTEKACKKMLGICFQNRYLPSSRKAFELIQSGTAGKVLGTRAFVTWSRNEAYYTQSGWRGSLATECGGVMINQAIHTLDLMLWLVGEPEYTEGTIHNRHLKNVIQVEDTAEIFLDFGNNIKGLFYATTAYCTDAPVYLEVVCENMTIRLLGDELYIDRQKVDLPSEPVAVGKPCWGTGHSLLIHDFYQKIDENGYFPINLKEAYKSLKVLLDLYRTNAGGF